MRGEDNGLYFDHAATTPMRDEVREAMAPYEAECFGNPSSVHRWGQKARVALEEARERLASALGAKRREICFTGCGTEADNLAVLGSWRRVGTPGAGWVVCSAIEHNAVLGAVERAGHEGASRHYLAVDEDGRVDPAAVDEALTLEPAVVAVMWLNNEVGTVQPVRAIAERCRERGVRFHTDAVQAFGRVPVRVDEVPCDFLAVSGHKIGGPKGVGALYVRQGVEVEPLTYGGGQEQALRPGTQNVAAAMGMARAAEIAVRELESEAARLRGLRELIERGLTALDGVSINAAGAERGPHIMSVAVDGVDPQALIIYLDLEGLAVSAGSACHSGSSDPSHVLSAMGRTADDRGIFRLSMGRTTQREHAEDAVVRVRGVLERLRASAPLPAQ